MWYLVFLPNNRRFYPVIAKKKYDDVAIPRCKKK